MTEKELKKLNRYQLLELLLLQTQRADELQKKLDEMSQQQDNRELQVFALGSIAEASLELSGIFESAQKAADLYLENARKKAEEIEAEARAHAEAIIVESQSDAKTLLSNVKSKAELILNSARRNARSITLEAKKDTTKDSQKTPHTSNPYEDS